MSKEHIGLPGASESTTCRSRFGDGVPVASDELPVLGLWRDASGGCRGSATSADGDPQSRMYVCHRFARRRTGRWLKILEPGPGNLKTLAIAWNSC